MWALSTGPTGNRVTSVGGKTEVRSVSECGAALPRDQENEERKEVREPHSWPCVSKCSIGFQEGTLGWRQWGLRDTDEHRNRGGSLERET